MSLVRIAARIAAVQALKGRTKIEDKVLDSKIGALDIAADGSVRTYEERLLSRSTPTRPSPKMMTPRFGLSRRTA